MFPLALAGLGIGAIGAIGGMISNAGSGSKLDALIKQDPTYRQSPYAAQRLGLAQTLLNARMPGAAAMERNVYGNQANQLGNVNRNATDSSQALALGSAAQGQTNQAFQNLSTQEQQDYYNRYQNFTGAQQGMIAEGDKVYQDQMRRYQDLAAVTGAKIQNKQTAWNSLANFGIGAAGVASQLAGVAKTGVSAAASAAKAVHLNFHLGSTAAAAPLSSSYMPGWINPMQNQGVKTRPWFGMGQNPNNEFPYNQ
jgi:hypothetical protein